MIMLSHSWLILRDVLAVEQFQLKVSLNVQMVVYKQC